MARKIPTGGKFRWKAIKKNKKEIKEKNGNNNISNRAEYRRFGRQGDNNNSDRRGGGGTKYEEQS